MAREHFKIASLIPLIYTTFRDVGRPSATLPSSMEGSEGARRASKVAGRALAWEELGRLLTKLELEGLQRELGGPQGSWEYFRRREVF